MAGEDASEEALATLTRAFHESDVNQDGSLDVAEFEVFLPKVEESVETEAGGLTEVANSGCKSQSDQDQIARQRSTLSDEVTNIVIGCIGRAQSCINSQIQAKGFSSTCSACVGNMGTCAKDNCKFTCTWNGFKSEACKSCTVQYCFGDLVSCSGLPREQLPDP